MADEHPGTDELTGRLQAYASTRLAPERGATARIRASLIEEARMRSLRMSLAPRHGRAYTIGRRVATVLLAAGLAIGAVASVSAASTAGGPLYGTRVWLETALLPTDSTARAIERLHQIDERVLEVERAAQSGDAQALAAAIGSYDAAVQAAASEVPDDPNHLAHLRAALGLHVVVLETLVGQVPTQAASGIDGAIAASQKAVVRIDAAKPGKSQGNGQGNGQGPASTNDPTSNGAPTQPPSATDEQGGSNAPRPTQADSTDHGAER